MVIHRRISNWTEQTSRRCLVSWLSKQSRVLAIVSQSFSVGAMRPKGDVSESRKEERLVGREIIEISVVRGILAGSSLLSSTRGAESLPV